MGAKGLVRQDAIFIDLIEKIKCRNLCQCSALQLNVIMDYHNRLNR